MKETESHGNDKSRDRSLVLGGLSQLGRAVPTLAVLTALAGVGYFGHQTGWKMPKLSALIGNDADEKEDWCATHCVPESECVACNAELMPKEKLHGWCKLHGVHECPLCHPESAQLNKLPEYLQTDLDRARRALAPALPKRDTNDPECKLHLRRIQFTSAEAVAKAGITVQPVRRAPVVESLSASGKITYDPTRVARLSSRAAGTAWRVEKSIGDPVHRGEVLMLVDAAEVGRAKAELLQAVSQLDLQAKTYSRLAGLGGVLPAGRLQEAETARAEASIALHKAIQTLTNLGLPIAPDELSGKSTEELARKMQFLGLPANVAGGFDPQRTTSNLIPLIAPRDGTVVARDVVAGEVVDTSQTLFTVADTERMWLLLDVPLEDMKYITAGQKVAFQPDGEPSETEGAITWISTAVDSRTRTVKVRAELPNGDGRLRDELFGSGRVLLRKEQAAIVVPSKAVHSEGCCHVVFVRDKDFRDEGSYKVFHTRSVRPGVKLGDQTELIAGLLPGEWVAIEGSGVLRAELLKGNLGAG